MNMHKLCFDYFISLDTNGEAKAPKTAGGHSAEKVYFQLNTKNHSQPLECYK